VPQASAVRSPSIVREYAAPPFVCSWQIGGWGAAWVQVAGELDLATSPQFRQTRRESIDHNRRPGTQGRSGPSRPRAPRFGQAPRGYRKGSCLDIRSKGFLWIYYCFSSLLWSSSASPGVPL
jgi:hypothetical protein